MAASHGARTLLRRARAAVLVAALGCAALGFATSGTAAADDVPALPAGTFCQGPQPFAPAHGPTHVMHLVLENESAQDVDASPDAPFERGTLDTQCGTFGQTNMKSTTHGSQGNYMALVSGLNPAINGGADAAARFSLSDCPPDSTVSSCSYGGGHLDATVPSIFSQLEQVYGAPGWKTYADDMDANCSPHDATVYSTSGKTYYEYVVRHDPAVYVRGIACASQVVPSGNWRAGQGPLAADLAAGTVPPYSLVVPNDIDNGHDPVSVAGGRSQIGNIDDYLSAFLGLVQQSPQYQSGDLVVMVTFDEGFRCGPGDCGVGENCADPNVSPVLTSCDVKTWIVGRYVPSRTYTGYMNQFGLLAATQRLLGLSPLLGHAGDAAVPDVVNGTAADPNPFGLAPAVVPPPSAPYAPTNPVAVPGAGQVRLAWNPPVDGGPPITDYAVAYRPSGTEDWTTADHPPSSAATATVTGLTDGTPYEFAVAAVNGLGTGPRSAIVPATPVAAPPVVELLPDPGFESGNGGWTPFNVGTFARVASPVHGGGSALRIAATGSGTALVGMTQNSVVSSSTAGQAYTAQCWVQPTGGSLNVLMRLLEYTQNFGSFSTLQSTTVATLPTGAWTLVRVTGTAVRSGERVIPQIYSTRETTATGSLVYDDCSVTAAAPAPATLPGGPTAVTATAGNGTATVAFSPPASDGGSPITRYTVVSSPGGVTATGTASPLPVGGLTNGTAYTFTVTATNAVGAGPASAPSVAVTPAAAVPGPPTGVSASPGDQSAIVAFSAPSSDGGSPITGYTVTSSPGGFTATGTASPLTVTGLTNGTTYRFTVTATNAVGPGPASATSGPVTPASPTAVPGPPTGVTAQPGNATAVVTFTPPSSTGGSPISGYTVVSSPGGLTATGPSSPIPVPGLTNGTAYTFTVTATNAGGPGPASAPSAAVTPTADLLPDPGFESGNGGWTAFTVGTFTRVTTPLHGGARALRIAATSPSAALVGMTQNSVVPTSVAGRSYTASCWVRATSAGLNVQIRWLEYTQNFGSNTRLQTTTVASLPANTWTLVSVTSTAVRSGERMVPQIYSTNETTATGTLLYDDCSVTAR
jgi:hypothetical protein